MLAAGPMDTEYRFDRPVVRLMKELGKRPKLARVWISKGDTQLELRGPAGAA
jgi:hypothetical protein